MPTGSTPTLAEVVLDFFNAVDDPYEIHFRIMDDPSFGSSSGRGISLTTAQAILDARSKLPKKKFKSIGQLAQVAGVGEDSLHDILFTFYDPSHPLAGAVSAYAMESPPDGWLECNGQAVSRTGFARLFGKIGIKFGQGDGLNSFNVPELRGQLVRGWSSGGASPPGRAFGSLQYDKLQNHVHSFFGWSHSTQAVGNHLHDLGGFSATGWDGTHAHLTGSGGTLSPPVQTSTPPIGDAVLIYCIKT